MIPADVASRIRLAVQDQPAPTQAISPTQNLNDVLSDLVPGQRIMAEIQALLPNGTYRALVAQREITLALPFSAKSGDSLELEVVESDSKLTLAFVTNRTAGAQAGAPQDSVATTLSQTGKLIGDLLGGVDNQGKRAAPAALNGNQPLVASFPTSAADLAPVLKDALSQSGVFYEAHQARWAAGQLPTEQLLQEPQGQHSSLTSTGQAALANNASADAVALSAKHQEAATSVLADQSAASARTQQASAAGLPPDLAPLVQQQLDALATQTFAWQGQIWPGQQMHWEIDDQQNENGQGDAEAVAQWQTRLKLHLPQLGGIEATLRLRPGNEVAISLSADSKATEANLDAAAAQLQKQFESAGLNLTQLIVKHDTPAG